MKLSKKIAIMFTITSIVTVVLYISAAQFMTKYLYDGEIKRISNISYSGVSSVNGEIAKVRGKGTEYSNLIQIANSYNEELNVDSGLKKLGIEEKFQKDGISFKTILSKDLKEVKEYKASSINEEDNQDYNKLLNEIKEEIKKGKESFNGFITGEVSPYIVTVNPIGNIEGNNTLGYFILINKLDNNKIKEIGKNVNKDLAIEEEVDKSGEVREERFNDKVSFTLVKQGKVISSYYKIPKLLGEKDFFIKTTEPMVVKSSTDRNTLVFSIILICINILLNIILLILIEKLVVKRLNRINIGINKINDSKNLRDRIEEESGNDEITVLSKDINNMFKSLEESNTLVLSKEKKYSKLIDCLENGYAYFKVINDEEGRSVNATIIEVNASLAKMIGRKKEDIISKTMSEVFINDFIKEKDIKSMLEKIGDEGQTLVRNSVKVGDNIWAYLSLYTIEEGYFAMVLTDISENKKFAEEMRYLANYDVLTNLQNRYSLYNYMAQLKEDGEEFTIYFIDLDNFKTLNDTLGHNTGDEVLCTAAQVLISIDNKNITVGRLGGDEFLVVIRGTYNVKEVNEIGKTILNSLNTTFRFKNYSYELKASIGVSTFPNHTDDIETLLKYADIAMYKSKVMGGNKLEIFSTTMLEDIIIETELKEAIENGEFNVYYQPIYNLFTNEIVGAEALIRWMKKGEIIPPYKFIAIAKKTGDITDIDNFVLEEACAFCKKKREMGHKDFQVSVNASYRFLRQPNFIDILKGILSINDLDPSGLKLEITEDEIIDDEAGVVKLLEEIKKLGIKVALDDFGVGYSSFSYIKILPIDTIKIDRSLLLKIEYDPKTLAIITTLIQLAHTLDLDVVAEGVEIEEQLNLLKGLNCDKIQGYLISKPVPKEEFNKIMRKQ
ncbi:EAL domain-containing protein [Clostridium paraputrificum]|uniref:bifunctional diguanylate cyclase/phosphodiesterase n=1 Tax=Clostridium paraputrificum TaxID=29363 RepID=UPI003D32DB00